ncbi:OpgC domain-containing protein [Pigmentiphaga aceris]|uniref:OpgC domain-containing protein n=1 Tax=Pigmentiphaga aceris TaxID=1940612 RepID=A0A5C0B0R9_9BURK|nr:OpgC domain-containing protein [Pigmentiphaga aceris]QEI07474.1 OpgC domain-containing protein [Pigmentiphaga aceris]
MDAKTPTRLLELDFFRGLVLLFIVVDHIANSVLAKITLRNYAIADAAEVFVFLAGLVTALSYAALARRRSVATADKRFLRRAWEIYVAFLITAALMVVCGLILRASHIDIPSLGPTEVEAFVAAPWSFLFQVFTLQRQPFLSDILPMYALFALLTPLLIRIGRKSGVALLALSLTVWLAAPTLGAMLPSAQPNSNWTFNPFAWQLLFVLGMSIGLRPQLPEDLSDRARRRITIAACCFAAFGAFCAMLWGNPAWHAAIVPQWVEDTFYPISKANAATLRVLSFMSVAWLVYSVCRGGRLQGVAQRMSLIAMIGRNGLNCFIGAAVISLGAEAIAYGVSGGEPAWPVSLTVDVLAILAVIAVAAWSESRSKARRAAAASASTPASVSPVASRPTPLGSAPVQPVQAPRQSTPH